MKKLVPVAMWQKIQPLVDEYSKFIITHRTSEYALSLEDADDESDFYFRCGHDDGQGKYVVEKRPVNTYQVFNFKDSLSFEDVIKSLINWLVILKEYSETHTFYDDPILKSYQEEFINSIKIEDDDADTAPFDFGRQLYLDQYLNNVKGLLETRRETATERQKEEIDAIAIECNALQTNLTRLTKNQTLVKLSKILAKARRYGLDMLKEFLSELKKEGIQTLTKKVLGGEISFDTILKLIE